VLKKHFALLSMLKTTVLLIFSEEIDIFFFSGFSDKVQKKGHLF